MNAFVQPADAPAHTCPYRHCIASSTTASLAVTPGAPWRIRLTDDIKARFSQDAGEGFLPMREAMRALGVSRQTVLQRVKRGELEAIHVVRGKQKGLRIKVVQQQDNLFDYSS